MESNQTRDQLQHLQTYYVFDRLSRPKDEDDWALRAQILDAEPKLGTQGDTEGLNEIPKEALKALIANTIVEFTVDKIMRGKHSRIEQISGTFIRALALCHSGKHLYQDEHMVYQQRDSTKSLDQSVMNELLHQHRSLISLAPRITCILDKDRYIYDRDMPHLSYEIEEVKVGSLVTAMVVDTSTDYAKLFVTLQNSKLQGCKMQPLDIRDFEDTNQRESRLFLRLGVSSTKERDSVDEVICGKFYTFEQLTSQAGINQYGTLNFKEKQVYDFSIGQCGFNFTKLREMQNLDWAEDSIMQGLQYESGFTDAATGELVEANNNKALEFYNNAIELDPLSKQALQLKGLLLKKLDMLQEAEETLVKAFKLDPEDQEIEQILSAVMMLNRGKDLPEIDTLEMTEPPQKTGIEELIAAAQEKQMRGIGGGKKQYDLV